MSGHRLSEYVAALGGLVAESALTGDPLITAVTYDSREVIPGALFICKGVHFSTAYLRQAIEAGAVAYLSEVAYPEIETGGISRVLVGDIRSAIAEAGTLLYDREWDGLRLAGITGTKGKSTTTFFLRSILAAWAGMTGGPRPGIISSILNDDGVAVTPAVKTTPETLDLYANLHDAVRSGLEFMCLEVSSQALRYRRVQNLTFEVGCFLNISEDHISPAEHADFEDYLTAKMLLFAASRHGVVNVRTDEYARVRAAAGHCETVTTFGLRGPGESVEADVVGYDVVNTGNGQEFSVRSGGEARRYAIGLAGAFNVENALAAIAMAQVLGVPEAAIRSGLAEARVPGRMEVTRLGRGTTIIVDYAHQKLSVETLLSCVRADYPGAPVTMVFGTPGDKAWNRREEFGRLAAAYADEIYLTEEDPGDQSVEAICREIDGHVRAGGHKPSHIHPDRWEAIRLAIDAAPDDGVVLILGKGTERWQLRGAVQVATPSDPDMVQTYVNMR